MYPVFLDLAGTSCLVVGGGRIALRKVIALLRAEACVTVIAQQFCKRFSSVASCITMHRRSYDVTDVSPDYRVIIGATNDQSVNKSIAEQAAKHRILYNIVDQPELCSFIVPAVVRRGEISVAVATSGAAPRLSKYLKTVIARAVGPEWKPLVTYLADVRIRIRACVPTAKERARFWEALFENDLLDTLKAGGMDALMRNAEALIATYTRTVENNGEN